MKIKNLLLILVMMIPMLSGCQTVKDSSSCKSDTLQGALCKTDLWVKENLW